MADTKVVAELPTETEKNKVRSLWGQAVDYDRKRTETCLKLVKAVESLEEKYPKLRLMSGRDAEQYYSDNFGLTRTYLIKMRNIARMHEALGTDVAKELPAPWTTQQTLASRFKDDYGKLTDLLENKQITHDMEASEVRDVIAEVIPPKPRKTAPAATTGYVMQPMTAGTNIWNDGHEHICIRCNTHFELANGTVSTFRTGE